ncbi:MAG TPA: hypothetical protein VFL90_10840 [Methylomirabilota bacterium]|nr:hypothetical protein [Methylomirabilota bacterium]
MKKQGTTGKRATKDLKVRAAADVKGGGATSDAIKNLGQALQTVARQS